MDRNVAALPRGIREALGRISNAEVVSDPDVIAATNGLRSASERHDSASRVGAALLAKIGDCEHQQSELAEQIAAIDAARPQLVARIIAGSAVDAEDRAAQARRTDLVRRSEGLNLALPVLRTEQQTRAGSLRYASESVADASTQLANAIFSARVSLARQAA